MISAVNMFSPALSASVLALSAIFTLNARIQATSFRPFSNIRHALFTSFLFTTPIPRLNTGISLSSMNFWSASKAPRVLALMYTPSSLNSPRFSHTSSRSSMTVSFNSSKSSPSSYNSNEVPAMALDSSRATILTPIAPSIFLWCWYSPFTRNSFMGCGVSKALICVEIASPLDPQQTIVSPSRRVPLTRTTSIVVPMPGISFTSRIVHCKSLSKVICSFMNSWVM
mmetsp:Transcript_1392/g.2815  ORF Transcript_1392/g.2815 Transcript_1392/m.2815 type:complete len:226 (-) Transcript_1392:2013-2690(-)